MPEEIIAADWKRLRDAVVALYRATPSGDMAAAFLHRAANEAAACDQIDIARTSGGRKSVVRHLEPIAIGAEEAELSDVLHAFLRVETAADWVQNPNYTAATIGQNFVDGYGYVEFLGPGRVFDCGHLRIGFLLLAPGLTYPDHAHPAEEVYHVVSGTAGWWREDMPMGWRNLPPGALIHHRPRIRHATRTHSEPLLALYCWGGDIGPHAALSDARSRP